MNLIDNVQLLADQFMVNPKYVYLDQDAIAVVAEKVADQLEFREGIAASQSTFWGYPKCIDPVDSKALNKLFLYEIIANSVNYCYWYGRYDIRPNGSDSTKMYKLLDESFEVINRLRQMSEYSQQYELEIIIDTFANKLSQERFPLLDHRIRHLDEIRNREDLISRIDRCVQQEDYSVDKWLEYLVLAFPGYGKDLFLKRAFLFIIEMYRRCRLFKEEIGRVPVPTDYQIPKMLRSLGCIQYAPSQYAPYIRNLACRVDSGCLIFEGSQQECEIRAATIVACRKIAGLAECSCADVDTYLFSKRYECKDPFHLTITSNY